MNSVKNKLVIRAVILVAFLLVLVIILSFIHSIINERKSLYDETVADLGSTWGREQVIAGPVLVIPFVSKGDNAYLERSIEGRVYTESIMGSAELKKAVILPLQLNAKIDISDEVRNRGIYKATVYTAKLKMSGSFKREEVEKFFGDMKDKKMDIQYNKAYVSFGLTDKAALTYVESFMINGKELKNSFSSGTNLKNIRQFNQGVSAEIGGIGANDVKGEIAYDISMTFRGSNRITVLPIGEDNKIIINSAWDNPSFEGIPTASKNITNEGFTAEWVTSKLSRNYPQGFIDGENHNLSETFIGVKFYEGVTHYRLVVRAVKYGYLFFALSLLVLFIFDIVGKNGSVHFLQYGIIGVSLVMFYLLLLSLTEHISFIPAYLISTAAVVIPISLYTIGFMGDKKYGVGIFAILTGLYMILLSILKMENYALMMGTLLVMVTIYALMYLTRHLKGESIKDK